MIEHTPSDLTTQLIARAWKDEAFKQELLRDPTAVVERELRRQDPDARLPEQVQRQVLEETPTTRYLVLPAKPTIESGEELTDADLEFAAAAGRPVPSNFSYYETGCCPAMN